MSAMERQDERSSERTCAGCRTTAGRDDLLRFVVSSSPRTEGGAEGGAAAPVSLVPDIGRKLPGRGVSVHPKRACLDLAVKRGGFAKSLERAVSVDAPTLAVQSAAQYRARALGLLLAAGRARKLAIGTDATKEAIEAKRANALLVTRDAAGRREELEHMAQGLGARCIVFGDKQEIGGLYGRPEVSVLAILDSGIAEEVALAAVRAADLVEDE